MAATHLHTYQCSLCKSTATTTVRTGHAVDLKCVVCQRFMRYLFSEPIETDAQRVRAAAGVVYNNRPHYQVNTKRQCDECKQWVEKESMIRLGVGGKYCSQPCAEVGTEKHRAAMEQQQERLEKLYQQNPWLRPGAKETA